ncbi:MAG: sugar phosphate isomerase/epimerase family protein [Rhodothermales bacterium]|nr:sugar phosphate isomerase/epimerase family protein [Rhodothermales bacterium]
MTRRRFIAASSALAALPLAGSAFAWPNARPAPFRISLNPGNIGVAADQKSVLQMAIDHGYQAIVSMPDQLAAFSEVEMADHLSKMKAHDITWESGNLPVDFRTTEAAFSDGLKALPRLAAALERAGATRMNTWIMPFHNELTYTQNWKQHAARLRACAEILDDHDARLGLEYVGPKTLLTRGRYPFLRTMAEARELIADIGGTNVGLVLDSFHWYCAEDTEADIRALTPADVVVVDLNDARVDLSRDEQIDGTRELPGATGKINLKAFLIALAAIGYDGPIRAEPFNQPLRDMDDQEALRVTYEAMARSFKLVGEE